MVISKIPYFIEDEGKKVGKIKRELSEEENLNRQGNLFLESFGDLKIGKV